MLKYFSPLLLLFAFAGCNNTTPEVQERLNAVDSLDAMVAEVEQGLQMWQDSSLADDAEQIHSLYNHLDKYYPKNEDRSFWIDKMNLTKRVYKGLGKFAKAKDELSVDIALSKKQLEGLRNSLEAEKLTADEQQNYLDIERRAAEEIHGRFFRFEPEAKVCLAIWDTLGPKMYAIQADLDTLVQAQEAAQ